MSDLQNFEGDLLLEDTPDGGDIQINNDLFVNDQSFNTAVYLSLFGGNRDDSGKIKNKNTWWGNTLPGISENEKIVSRFQNTFFILPMTSKNIRIAEDSAKIDLQWIIDEGIGDKIIISGQAISLNKFLLTVNIFLKENNIYKNDFILFWRGYKNGVSK